MRLRISSPGKLEADWVSSSKRWNAVPSDGHIALTRLLYLLDRQVLFAIMLQPGAFR